MYYPERQVYRSPHLSLHPSTTPRDRSTGRHISHFIHLLHRKTSRQAATSFTSYIYYPERQVDSSPHLPLHLYTTPEKQVDRSPHLPLHLYTTLRDRSTGSHISLFLHLLPRETGRQVATSPTSSIYHHRETSRQIATSPTSSIYYPSETGREVATSPTSSIYYPERQVDRSSHLPLHLHTTPRDMSTGRHISHFIHVLPQRERSTGRHISHFIHVLIGETGRQVATSLTSSMYYPRETGRHVAISPTSFM